MSKEHLLNLLCRVYVQEISADEAFDELEDLIDRIKRLEEQLMEAKNKHAVLVADVVLRDDKIERINQLEAALRRIANTDYRGNRSAESQIAFEALKP